MKTKKPFKMSLKKTNATVKRFACRYYGQCKNEIESYFYCHLIDNVYQLV